MSLERLKGRDREQALWLIQNDMADKHQSLPHEERYWAVARLDEYESDPERATNMPFAHARLRHFYDKPTG